MKLKEFIDDKEKIEQAKEFATKAHEGQFRKFGNKPYISHPADVANLVQKYGGNTDMIISAWLHDTVEDVGISFEEIKEKFGDKVASIVKELTNPADLDKSQKGKYLADKMSTMSSDALTIKLADRLSNVSDFKNASPKFVQKYAPETRFILNSLEDGERPLNRQQELIIQDIGKAIEPYEVN
jgi:(p)ppGpp synthase/HD superfamily hydrolase